MRTHALLGVAAILVVAGCRNDQPSLPSDFRGPTAVVPVAAFTHIKPGELRDYLAIASSHGNELRFFDPSDDRSVPGPIILSNPLAIITRPDPTLLASASLSDGSPDVLVAVSAGSQVLQLVSTWEDATGRDRSAGNRVVREIDLAPLLAGGDEILFAIGTPVPGPVDLATNFAAPVPGRARVLVGASGGKLIAVDFIRGPDNSVLDQPPVVQAVGFDPVHLALSPTNFHVYAATGDIITGTNGAGFGVAELDMSSSLQPPWTIRFLDALAPTRVVAAQKVAERLIADPDQFEPTPKLRVYAGLDLQGCGFDKPIGCGIVTLDPVTAKLELDPVGQMPYRAPMAMPSLPLDLKTALPPGRGPITVRNWINEAAGLPGIFIAPGTGKRITSAVGAVPSSDGKTYLIDLGRWQIPGDTSLLKGQSRFAVSTIELVNAKNEVTADPAQVLGLRPYAVAPGGPDDVAADATAMFERFVITPGFTPTDDWRVTYQGVIANLGSRAARIGRLTTGEPYVAIQQESAKTDAAGNPIWTNAVTVADASLGIHVGDVTEMAGVEGCEIKSLPESTIASLAPPDPIRFPGGALVLAAMPACMDAALAQSGLSTLRITLNVRASGFVLNAAALGYAGRPVLDQPFALEWADESTLTGEGLALARKARRHYYPSDTPCTVPEDCKPLVPDPLKPGPAIAFKLGLPAGALLERNMSIHFITQSGVALASRLPRNGGTLPTATAVVDRSKFVGRESAGMRFYVTYAGDDAMIEFSPSEGIGEVLTFRTLRN